MNTRSTVSRNVFCAFLPKNIARFSAIGSYADNGDFIGSIYFTGSDTAIGVTTDKGFQLENAVFSIEKLNTDLSVLIERVFLPDFVMRSKALLKAKRDRMIQDQASESFTRFMTETSTAKNGTAKNGTAKNGTAKNGTAKNGTAKNGTAKNGTAKNGTAKNGTAKNGTATELVTADIVA